MIYTLNLVLEESSKDAIDHWPPPIGEEFWWTGVFFVLLFVPLMLIVGKKHFFSFEENIL